MDFTDPRSDGQILFSGVCRMNSTQQESIDCLDCDEKHMANVIKKTKEERKAKREAEKLRPKRKYVKKCDRLKSVEIINKPVTLSFD